MKVTISGTVKDIGENTTVGQLVINEQVDNPEYVTVTVNDEFVDHSGFETTVLKENDVIEFLYFMGGGCF
jgi:sulfur carrier protein